MKIVTHNAKFHADDVFAVASLLILYPDAEIIRTRDPQLIKEADIVVDVGEVDDPEKNRFDHHQAGGAGRRENGIPYASFGLVWKKFGKEICGSQELADRIDRMVAQPMDAPDNGEDICMPKIPGVFPFDAYSIVSSYRITWKEEEDWDNRFRQCLKWAKEFLERKIKFEKDVLEGREIVHKTYKDSKDKKIIVIDKEYDLGRELVNDVLVDYPESLYGVLYRKDHKNWQVISVRNDHDSFELRKRLPEEWGAKHYEELEKVTGVKGAIFCHRRGFMCVAETEEAALELAKKALDA